MIRLRFPNGSVVEYRLADQISLYDTHIRLLKKSDDKASVVIADVPFSSGAIVEYERPYRVLPPEFATPGQAAEYLLSVIQEVQYGKSSLVYLKRKLQDFDSRTLQWKKP
jgi:hypothetical protein